MHEAIKIFCQKNQLGFCLESPEPVTGGLRHQCFKLKTTQGLFLLKILSNFVMTKPGAIEAVLATEALSREYAQHGISAVCALPIHGEYMGQLATGEFVLLYPWVPGIAKYYPNFGLSEVQKIATCLAQLHGTFLAPATNQVLSHCDLDPKNILWHQDDFYIIDWEDAGPIDPMEELVALAFEWSGFERGAIDHALFEAFFAGYAAAGGVIVKSRLSQGLQGFIQNYQTWQDWNLAKRPQLTDPAMIFLTEQVIAGNAIKLAFLRTHGLGCISQAR